MPCSLCSAPFAVRDLPVMAKAAGASDQDSSLVNDKAVMPS